MTLGADVIVIGGGIVGCAAARELAARGARVRLFESRTVAAGATQASAGMLAPYIEAHERGPLFDLTIRSLAMFDDFVARAADESGIPVEYRRNGSLEIAMDEAAAAAMRRAAGDDPAAPLRWLPAAEARRLEPALPDALCGALLAPAHGYVVVSSLTEALAWAALKHGAQIETGRSIHAIARKGNRLHVTADDGTTWSASDVIVAAGCWAGRIDVDDSATSSVKPIRGQLLRLKWNSDPFTHVLWGNDCYLVPWQDGTVLVGATVEDVGFDDRTTAAGVRDLLDAVCELLPEAWRATFLEARAGLRPATGDGLPIIGPSARIDGLFYATGHFRNGVLLAPLTASIVANWILEGKHDPALALTAPGRMMT